MEDIQELSITERELQQNNSKDCSEFLAKIADLENEIIQVRFAGPDDIVERNDRLVSLCADLAQVHRQLIVALSLRDFAERMDFNEIGFNPFRNSVSALATPRASMDGSRRSSTSRMPGFRLVAKQMAGNAGPVHSLAQQRWKTAFNLVSTTSFLKKQTALTGQHPEIKELVKKRIQLRCDIYGLRNKRVLDPKDKGKLKALMNELAELDERIKEARTIFKDEITIDLPKN